MLEAIKQNSNNNQSKGRYISVSWISLVVGMSALVIYAGIFVVLAGPVRPEIRITLQGNTTTIQQVADSFQAMINNTSK